MQVHQFLPTLSYGDATANHVLQFQHALRKRFESEIFYDNADPKMAQYGRHFWDYSRRLSSIDGDALLLYHLGIGSPMAHYLLDRPESLLLYYHNITPAEYFAPYDEVHVRELSEGRQQLKWLAPKTKIAWGASEFSVKELREAGYPTANVLPLLIDFRTYDQEPHRRTLTWLKETKGTGPDVLFVGRIAPNKKQEDLVKLMLVYRDLYGAGSRLFLLGSHHPHTDAYSQVIKKFAEELEVENVTLLGGVSFDRLLAYYHGCDVFVSMSEHEGFGLPLIEAMYLGLPTVAYSAAAVAETVGSGGILHKDKDLALFAASIQRLWSDDQARNAVVEAGRQRASDFAVDKIEATLLDQLAAI